MITQSDLDRNIFLLHIPVIRVRSSVGFTVRKQETFSQLRSESKPDAFPPTFDFVGIHSRSGNNAYPSFINPFRVSAIHAVP